MGQYGSVYNFFNPVGLTMAFMELPKLILFSAQMPEKILHRSKNTVKKPFI